MGMKNTLLATALMLATMQAAQAGTITDNYIGSDSHGYGDVISSTALASTYNISSAVVTRVGSILTVAITTGFAGKANTTGVAVGYGDLFLSNAWAPNTATAGYASDSLATTGTAWKYALSLNEADRLKNNATNTTTLYKVSNSTSAINTTKTVMTAAGVPSNDIYRDGQIDTVNKSSGSTASIVKNSSNAAMTGQMLISDASDLITFTINIAGTEMMNWDSFAIHWGETCQNDVIEGITSVPEPTGLALFGLGLAGLMVARRRKMM